MSSEALQVELEINRESIVFFKRDPNIKKDAETYKRRRILWLKQGSLKRNLEGSVVTRAGSELWGNGTLRWGEGGPSSDGFFLQRVRHKSG